MATRPFITCHVLNTITGRPGAGINVTLQLHHPSSSTLPSTTIPTWTATTNAPILHPVFAASDGAGGLVACREGSQGCVRFEIGDINALMAEVYLDAPASLIGSKCNTPVLMSVKAVIVDVDRPWPVQPYHGGALTRSSGGE